MVRIIIYPDNMLLMTSSSEDFLMARDTLIFKLLGVMVDSGKMTLSLPKEKLFRVQNHCHEILEKGIVTVRN